MSENDASFPKKKKLKKWQIFTLVIVALIAIGGIFGEDTSTTDPAPEASKKPAVTLEYSAEITSWKPSNPASGNAVFTIVNTGKAGFIPESCIVRVQDDSGTYKGYDYVSGFTQVVKPGAKFMGNVNLTVTKEGAFFVTTGSVDCELKAA